jgi:ABC-type dipeptide/oligopeptide/nickel transport system ATPase component
VKFRIANGVARGSASPVVLIVKSENRPRRTYPWKLVSGCQFLAVVAMAISRNPALLIANKPTTGLDVMTQKVVMNLLTGIAAVLVSASSNGIHDGA